MNYSRGPKKVSSSAIISANDTDLRESTIERNQLLRLLKYVWHYWRLLPLVLISMVGATLLELVSPWLMGVVLIDQVIMARDASLLPWVVLGLLAAVILRQGFEFAHRYFLALLSQGAIHLLRCDLYDHIENLPLSHFNRTPVGDLVSRQVTDAEALEEGLKALVTEAGVHLVMVFGILGLLFTLNAKLTLMVLPFMVLLAASMHVFRRAVKGFSFRVRDRLGRLSSLVTETLTGIGVVKAFGMEPTELNRFTRTSNGILLASVRLARLEGFYHISVEMILIGSVVMVIWLAAPQVLADQMTVGALVAYLAYLARFQEPLKGLSKANFKLQKAMGAAQRIFEVLDTPVEDQSGPDTIILPKIEGSLRFDQVTFGYRPDEPVLRDFSLEIRPGEVVALLGPSGVGKSTLVNLLLRHYTPLSGTITVDGHRLETLNASSLRRQISLVPQEPFLFSTTVRENILYGRPEASDAEVKQAARAANIHDFIAALPEGYQTPVGQRGLALSGGQRQRIALARAFLRDAPVLLMDEATTSVDLEAEALIQEAVAKLMGGRTTLIIAHRLSSLHHAQRIVILEEGRVSGEGSHQDLLAGNRLYRRLYDIQTLARTT